MACHAAPSASTAPWLDAASQGIDITVQDPEGKMLMTRHAQEKGRFSFHSEKGGEYNVCLMTNSSNYYGYGEHRMLEFHLKMDIGAGAQDYAMVAKKEHLSSLQLEIRKLNDRVKHILKEQHYMRENEAAFRDTSEACNSQVAYWSLGQTVVLIIAGVWQIMHLKRFFEAKKLV